MSQESGSPKTFVAASAVTQYRLVKVDSDGEVAHCGAGEAPDGRAEDTRAAGERVAVRLMNQPGSIKLVAAGAFSKGALLYTAAAGKVDDALTGGPAVFRALEAATADLDVIEAIPVHQSQGGTELHGANLVDSAEVENTTDETAFDKKVTINGDDLVAGDVLEIITKVRVVDNNSTDTLTLKTKLGTEVLATGPAVDVADGDLGTSHLFVTVREAGATGKLSVTGSVALGVPGTATLRVVGTDEVAEDLTGDIDITVTGTWSVAHADNEALLEDLIVIRHRA